MDSNMKKVVAFALVILCALFIARSYALVAVTVLTEDGYALSEDVSSSLKQGTSEEVYLSAVNTDDEVWQRGSWYYVGEDQSKVSSVYPLYLYGGTAVMTLSSDMTLYDQDFLTVSSIMGMYISDGIAFLSDHTQTEEEIYLFMKLSNGLFLNLAEMEIDQTLGETVVPLNSLLYMSEDTLHYYSYKNGVLNYGEASVKGSTVRIGDLEMSWEDLLRALGLLSDDVEGTEDDDDRVQDRTDESDIQLDEEGNVAVIVSGGNSGANSAGNTGDGENTGSEGSSAADSSSGSGSSSAASAAAGSAGSGSSSGSGSGSGDSDSASSGDSSYEEAAGDAGYDSASGSSASGTHSGSSSGSAAGSLIGGEGADYELTPTMPSVTLSNMETGVYTLTMDVDIIDDYGLLSKVLVEVYCDQDGDGYISEDEVGSRKSTKTSGSITVSSIPPDTNILVVAKYYYYDNGTKKIVVFYDEFSGSEKVESDSTELKTKSLDTLAPIYIDFTASGNDIEYHTNYITLYDLQGSGPTDLLNYVYRLSVTVENLDDATDTNTYYISKSALKNYLNTTGNWNTTAKSYELQSDSKYSISVQARDSFGNDLKVLEGVYDTSLGWSLEGDYSDVDGVEGDAITAESRTCKVAPSAELTVKNDSLGVQTITIRLTDTDRALSGSDTLYFEIFKYGSEDEGAE